MRSDPSTSRACCIMRLAIMSTGIGADGTRPSAGTAKRSLNSMPSSGAPRGNRCIRSESTQTTNGAHTTHATGLLLRTGRADQRIKSRLMPDPSDPSSGHTGSQTMTPVPFEWSHTMTRRRNEACFRGGEAAEVEAPRLSRMRMKARTIFQPVSPLVATMPRWDIRGESGLSVENYLQLC
jgi:hypothetical protein